MRIACLLAVSAIAVASVAPAEARDRYHRHHHHDGAAVGAALGAGIFLGALAASSANAREEVYIEEAPPPPAYGYENSYRDRGEDAEIAIDACRRGLLDAARKYGAYDAEVGDIYSVRDTPYGQEVRAEVTIDYPQDSRTSIVTCETEDGLLISARSEY
jgi:hypothetical protein